MSDQGNRIERCPLGCGSPWHGLPRVATYQTSTCPSPFGVPVPVVELVEEEANVA